MSWSTRTAIAGAIACGLVGFAADAHADDPTKEQCIEANEGAQSLRQRGKLRAARAQLQVCVAKSCPGPVREDCVERLAEVERATPTLVISAKDPAGADLRAVRVTMDGALLAERLEGTALAVEPGEHVVELRTEGLAAISKKLVVREGEKDRREVFAFVAPTTAAPAPAAPVVPAADASQESAPVADAAGSGQRTVAFVLGGAGVVGIGIGTVFGLVAKSTYDDAVTSCPMGPSSCDNAGITGGKDAHGQATISTIAFVAGAALLAGGVILYLTAPRSKSASVQPTATVSAAGVRLGAAW